MGDHSINACPVPRRSPERAPSLERLPQYCYQCVAGPDLFCVTVKDGAQASIEPNFEASRIHPAAGRVCVKAYDLLGKASNPHRLLQPMRRTNPRKGLDQDPGFVEISWDEALDLVAGRLLEARQRGLTNEQGFPRVAVTLGGGGTPGAYMGTFAAFLSAWGPVDYSFGSGQGVKCVHSEHLYGELWHRAFTVAADTPYCRLLLSFGNNVEVSGGAVGVWRQAAARGAGQLRRIQLEPQLSVTGGASSEWIPIRPKTDAAFMFAMLHVMLREVPRPRLDLPFLRDRTSSPYLVGPHGFYLRDPVSRKPLVWDQRTGAAVPFDTSSAVPALEGTYVATGVELGADGRTWAHSAISVHTALTAMVQHLASYTPEWAERICDVPAGTVRRVTEDFLESAAVGETIMVEGQRLPYRPVAVTLGRGVNNGWGGYEAVWGRTMLATLVGALEVPGGTLGTCVRLSGRGGTRAESVVAGEDGLMAFPFNATEEGAWEWPSRARNGYRTLVPLLGRSPWGAALGPTHLAWQFQTEAPAGWPAPAPPEVWFVYRANPVISAANSDVVAKAAATFPFTVCFAYTRDETNQLADLLLPDATDLESTQLIRIGGSRHTVEQFWEHEGFAVRTPAVAPPPSVRDISDVMTALAARVGLLAPYNAAINAGKAGVALAGELALELDRAHDAATIWDRICRAATAELSRGTDIRGLDWFRAHGFATRPFSRLNWYLTPALAARGLRFELPYQERLLRIGEQLRERLHGRHIHWWDQQLDEYRALPDWRDFPGLWETATAAAGGRVEDFPFWLIGSHSMQYATGSNAASRLMRELSRDVRGHGGVVMNTARAAELQVLEGDLIELSTPTHVIRGRALLWQGIRPDCLLIVGQFGHVVTPVASELQVPSLSGIMSASIPLTDATGSTADLVRVRLKRLGARA